MKFPAKIVASVLTLVLSGCVMPFHKQPPPPAVVLAPPVGTNTSGMPPTEPPPTSVTIPDKPVVNLTKLPAQTPPKPQPKHKRQPAPPPAETQQASVAEPAVSAIGKLSSGDPADVRRQTESSLTDTEKGLNGLNRQLNDQEKKTADHIREFIKQARAALASGDVDGASTLAAKAKVLLAELQH
jgi:outer membrane biosynthesis protein TonB